MNKYYCFNRTVDYCDRIEEIIQSRKSEILSFFGVDKDFELNFNIYVYDSLDDLVSGMRRRGFSDMPDYMCACQKDEDNSLNFFEPKDNSSSEEWSKDEYDDVIFHELVHGIQFMLYGTSPEWITEGIAKYLDGTYKSGIKSLLENYIHKGRIPTMDELENKFGFCEYDSYDYAYLMVSYLIETFGKDKFLKIIGDSEELNKVSQNLVTDSIRYYNKKYFGNEFYNSDLSNPNWLFHGSPLELSSIEMRQSHDSLGVFSNIDTAVFLTSSLNIASCYAFKDTIKKKSEGLDWDFSISSMEDFPIMRMENVVVGDDISGYIYVFSNDGSFTNDPVGSLQFKSYNNLRPISREKVYYEDFKNLYEVSMPKAK